ncbi:gene transfer agent family protein [Pseudochelatococcus sp. G4_1912]|uniref:gene transfer agent family protein n=1 Tax=Pseudochelatococcus sp. G4_1912 TaxID=3114288 RepID=UPI0039C752A7
MANRRRGEIEAVLGGEKYTLVLTLGALAELESAFGVADLAALGERLSLGKLSARDIICILQAGLAGAGADVDVARLPVAAALPEYARAVADLLAATFGVVEAASSTPDFTANP